MNSEQVKLHYCYYKSCRNWQPRGHFKKAHDITIKEMNDKMREYL